MKESPFIYGQTVSAKSFTDREEEFKKLNSNLLGGINTMIISPRRWGKSSLVEKVVFEINKSETDYKTAVIDLFSVSNEEDFLEKFAKEVIKATSNKLEDWIRNTREYFHLLIPQIKFGIDPMNDFSLSFNWKELKEHSNEVLNLPEVIATQKKIKLIICLDEFQNLSTFREYEFFEKKMRSIWQRQKNVTYCIYGSKRHMMTEIFNNPSKPFYRFGDIMVLQKISTEKWTSFICESFSNTGKSISKEVAEIIPSLMKNHSWYVQQFAHYTWNLTKKTAKIEEVQVALNELIKANIPLYQREIELYSSTQTNLLKAICKKETKLFSTNVMQTYHLGTPRNASKNKSILINSDVIVENDGKIDFMDPAFELWFRKQFFGEKIICSESSH